MGIPIITQTRMYKMSTQKILDSIKGIEDLRKLPDSDMEKLAGELREKIIDQVKTGGGHLASNLGVIELTLAIHRVFDTPRDKLIWDVGHQCYAHKLLTGRMDEFPTLRQPGGLSGFTVREESVFDPFGAGHSSTSISAALGFAEASRLDLDGRYAIAVLGDGAFTGGMVHEALNNIDRKHRLIIILNDNKMSISKSTGGFVKHLSNIRSSKSYQHTKTRTRSVILRIPVVGMPLFKFIRRIKKGFKDLFYSSNYFEDMGLYYLGPVDGHDYEKLTTLLTAAKEYNGPCLVHVKTTKGKGYSPAEKAPELYHGVTPGSAGKTGKNFSETLGDLLVKKAGKDRDICVITAAMKDGCGLNAFSDAFKDRFYDVGIAEEHALVFAAALAAAGKKPVFAVYSTFLQRGYDNVIHDIALQKLPVTVCIDRAGIASSDGPTHNGIFDVSMLSGLPGVTLFAPIDNHSLSKQLDICLASGKPAFIRYPNGCEDISVTSRLLYTKEQSPEKVPLMRSSFQSAAGCDMFIITYGRVVKEAFTAADMIATQGVKCGVLLLEKLLPLDSSAALILEALENAPAGAKVIFLEEGVRCGGLGECVYELLRNKPGFADKEYIIKAIDDPFARIAKKSTAYETYGISSYDILGAVYGGGELSPDIRLI